MATALFMAVENVRLHQAKLLIQMGVPVNTKNKYGENLLMVAINRIEDRKRRKAMVKWLMQLGVDVTEINKTTGRDSLTCAVVNNQTDIAKFIFYNKEEDINLRRIDNHGRHILHYAVLHNNSELVMLFTLNFKKYRMNVDIKDRNEITPYIISVKLGYIECANVLLYEGGASPSQVATVSFHPRHIWDGLENLRPTNQGITRPTHPPIRYSNVAKIVVSDGTKSFATPVKNYQAKLPPCPRYPEIIMNNTYRQQNRNVPNYQTRKQSSVTSSIGRPDNYSDSLKNSDTQSNATKPESDKSDIVECECYFTNKSQVSSKTSNRSQKSNKSAIICKKSSGQAIICKKSIGQVPANKKSNIHWTDDVRSEYASTYSLVSTRQQSTVDSSTDGNSSANKSIPPSYKTNMVPVIFSLLAEQHTGNFMQPVPKQKRKHTFVGLSKMARIILRKKVGNGGTGEKAKSPFLKMLKQAAATAS